MDETGLLTKEVNALLSEGYQMWEGFGLPEPEEKEKRLVIETAVKSCEGGKFQKEYAAACLSFYLFRKLHEMSESAPETGTLLGDYFFSRFSHYLIPIDNTRLIDLFSEYLKTDAKETFEKAGETEKTAGRCGLFCLDYIDFIQRTAKEAGLSCD